VSEDPQAIRLALRTSDGEVAVAWEEEILRGMASGKDVEQPWRLEGEVEWGRWQSLRVLSSAYEDGSLLVLASLRPRDAGGHDKDVVGALHAGPDASPAPLEDVLPSLHVGEDGLERFNLEASQAEGHGIVRAAGDVESTEDAGPVARSILRMRMAGASGFGTFDVLGRP
jgi:hypothetical protein